MKKTILTIIFGSLLLSCTSCQAQEPKKEEPKVSETFFNPLQDGADPWMVKVGDKYYTCASTGRSIIITESRFMTRIEKSAEVWRCPNNGWNAYNLWAPELHFVDGKWYIYYAASYTEGGPFINQRSGVLECDTPLGQYTDKGMLITGDDPTDAKNNIWAIDVNVFKWNGKLYATWSGWENIETTDQTPQHTYIAEMENPWTVKKRHLISKADQSWELGEAFGLQEGQEALINGSNLFIVYSTRGSWTKFYRLGYLKLKPNADPLLAASWEKSNAPVFEGTATVHGVGHASFVKSPDQTEDWIYYHTKKNATDGWERDVRLQKFTFDANGNPNFGVPENAGEMKRPSGETKIK